MKNSIQYWSTSSQVLLEEAQKLGFSVEILSENSNLFVVYGNGKSRLFKSTDCGANTALGMKIANDKELTSLVLDRAGVRMPRSLYLSQAEFESIDLDNTLTGFAFPLVVKPTDGAHGHGVRMDIRSLGELRERLVEGFESYKKMIVQEQVTGTEFRVLVLFGEVVLAIERKPAAVVGDGVSSIRELIEIENGINPLRAEGYHAPLARIEIDSEVEGYLAKRGLTVESVPKIYEPIQLRGNSNIGTGGTPNDITISVHPEIRTLCEDAARAIGLGICGVDVIAKDFTQPVEGNAVILELNATPGLGGHRELTSVNTAKELLIRAMR